MPDVVVVGSGCAGLAATVSAAQAGAQVLVLEKTARIGGAIHGGAGLFAVESAMQRDRQIALPRAEAFRLLMEHAQWRTDARVVSAYINETASTIDWLSGLGAEFSDVVAYYTGAHPTWHFREHDSPEITQVLASHARSLGVEFVTEAPARRLLVSDDGSVTGVEYDGGTVSAAAVVLATGGFGGSPELIERYTGYRHGEDLFSFAFPELTGDGLDMAWAAGAARAPMMMETYVCLPEPYWGPGGTPPDLGSFRQPNLLVNELGERFVDESVMRHPGYASNAVHRQPGGYGYMILTGSVNEAYVHDRWDFLMSKLPVTRPADFAGSVDAALADGFEHIFRASSASDLARQIGVPAERLAATVASYNAACRTGRDTLMHKPARYLRELTGDTWYAARFYAGGYGSLGGVAINDRFEVVRADGGSVAGLFGAGRDVNAIYGGTYPFIVSGNSTSFSYNSGRIAGRNAARVARAGTRQEGH